MLPPEHGRKRPLKTTLMWRGMLGIRALTATLMLLGLLAAGVRTASAQDDESGLDDNTFTGPNFGWSVEWDEDVWSFDEEDNSGGGDFAALSTVEDPFAIARFFGIEEFAGDPEDCVAGYEDVISGNDANDDVAESDEFVLPETPDGGEATTYTYTSTTDDGDIDLIEYVACQTLVEGEAVLIFTILTIPDVFEDLIPTIDDLVAEIVIEEDAGSDDEEDVTPESDDEDVTPEADDEETPEADDEDVTPDADEDDEDADADADAEPTRDVLLGDDEEETEEETTDDEPAADSGIDGEVYTSPTYGFAIEWDERDWTVAPDEELVASGETELDRVYLTHEDDDGFYSSLYVEGKTDYAGDPADCVEGEFDILGGGADVIDFVPFEDAGGDPIEGESDAGGEFAAFLGTFDDGDGGEFEIVEYVECLTIEDGESVLILTLFTTEDLFEDELALLQDVAETIELDGGGGGSSEATDDEPADDEAADEDPTEEPADEEEEDEAAFVALRFFSAA